MLGLRHHQPCGDVAEWLRSGLQSRLSRFDSGRRLHINSKYINDLGLRSQAKVTTETLDQGGNSGDRDCAPANQIQRVAKLALSVFIITKNEEQRLPRALDALVGWV